MTLLASTKKILRKFGIMSPLSFDQQVWGAKSVMDLVQHGSQFLLAEGVNGGSCYTCWLGSENKVATAIVIDSTGHATGPFPDSSKVQDCKPWTYPPKITCGQAVANMIKAGVTESWITCRLRQTTDQSSPNYYFTFATHAPVTVDAVTGKLI